MSRGRARGRARGTSSAARTILTRRLRYVAFSTTAVGRRALRAVLVAAGVLVVSFMLIRLVPGDPAVVLCDLCSAEDLQKFRKQLGLDGPLISQFADYARRLLVFDLGVSIRGGRPINDIIGERLPVSMGLVGLTLLLTLMVALPVGVAAALRNDNYLGHLFRITTAALIAMPVFFSGVIAILLVSVKAGIAPVGGYSPSFPESLEYLWLPAVVLAIAVAPIVARLLQQSIMNTLAEEFVEAGIARGLPRRVLMWRYLLRPSLGPTIILLGHVVGGLIGSAVMIELVFNLPGMGYTLIDAVLTRDYPLVQGLVLVSGIAVVLVNTGAELTSSAIDPRLRKRTT